MRPCLESVPVSTFTTVNSGCAYDYLGTGADVSPGLPHSICDSVDLACISHTFNMVRPRM
jgi:hypothetical protein